jgi:uncharacterized protein YbdZ (MbtH family)
MALAMAASCTQAHPAQQDFGSFAPANFSEYGAAPVGQNRLCVVGAVSDGDGLNQKPFVIVSDLGKRHAFWRRALAVPAGFYQSRATHCTASGSSLYVLLQTDTQPQQTLSQTQLSVEKLGAGSGNAQASMVVNIAGETHAYSAWVDESASNFSANGNDIRISGEFYRLDDPDDIKRFETVLPLR